MLETKEHVCEHMTHHLLYHIKLSDMRISKVNQRSRSGPESFKNLAGIAGEKANELKLNPVRM